MVGRIRGGPVVRRGVSAMLRRDPRLSLLLLVLLVAAMSGPPTLARGQSSAELPPPPFPASAPGDESWMDGAVCYEIFVRSFADSDGDGIGDFRGLIDRLDHVNDGDPATTNDLGATCVWLMPIMESASYHGYDVTDYYAVEADYGTAADYLAFVEAAHARGIRVILDLVLNHTSSQHPWFVDALADPASPYRDWYIFEDEDPGYAGPWGAQAWHPSPAAAEFYYGVFWEGMPDLDYRNPAVTEESRRISQFWLGEMGADGFRLDAIKHLIEDGRVQENTPETIDWLRDYRAWLDTEAPDAEMIGEIFGGSTFLLASYYPDGLHRFFHFEIGSQILTTADYGTSTALFSTLDGALTGLPDQRWSPFLSNHDQQRSMTTLGGDQAAAKLAASLLLTLPGTPFIYYGEEIGMTGVKPDERLRTPMQWDGSAGAGFTDGTPWEPLQDDAATVHVAAQMDDATSLLSHYGTMVHLRVATPALGTGSFLPLDTGVRGTIAFLRTSGDQTVLVIANAGTQPSEAFSMITGQDIPAGVGAPIPLGPAGAPALSTDGATLAVPSLPARSLFVYDLG